MAAHGDSARAEGRASTEGKDGEEPGGRPPPPSFEYRSRARVGGVPLVHVVRGIDPSSGRRPPAVGIIAVGQVAIGLVAVGQVAFGIISVGQAAIGLGWGIGQLAFGLLAAGQVASGAFGAIGQIATGPHALGIVMSGAWWVTIGWLLGGACLAAASAKRRRQLATLVAAPLPSRIADVSDGRAYVEGEVVSFDHLRAPLSSQPCVFWHAVAVGTAASTHERGGSEVTIADGSGSARIDLRGDVIFIRSGDYHEIVGPDWALHLETALRRGDTVHVAGPVTLGPDPAAAGAHRGAGISPLFAGRPEAPLIVTTESPATMRAALRFARSFAWIFVAGGGLAAVSWAMGC